MLVRYKKLNELAKEPIYADLGAAGFDFYATNTVLIEPLGSAVIETGIAVEIPEGYEIQVRGRSGLAFNGDVFAHVGTIDCNYRGEVKIKLFNLGTKAIPILPGTRVAQGVLAPVTKADFLLSEKLSDTDRGLKGFGSSGSF